MCLSWRIKHTKVLLLEQNSIRALLLTLPVMGKTFIGNNLTQGPPTISTNLVACKVYPFSGLESAEPSIIPHDKNTELKQKP